MTDLDRAQIIELLGSIDDDTTSAVEAIQQHGLRSLIAGRPISIDDIAQISGLSSDDLIDGIESLLAAGRIELDDDTIIGVGGLTTTGTVHALRLPDAQIHTWCALDGIGIPIAFGVHAVLTTICPYCSRQLQIRFADDEAHGEDNLVLFCPTGSCKNVRADFCTSTNLFCNRGHLAAWRHNSGRPEGSQLSLGEAVDLGREVWTPHAG
jgi:hypothetical protein